MRANHVGPGWGTGVSRRQNRLWKPGRAPREHRLRPIISALEGRSWDVEAARQAPYKRNPASGGKLAYFGTRLRLGTRLSVDLAHFLRRTELHGAMTSCAGSEVPALPLRINSTVPSSARRPASSTNSRFPLGNRVNSVASPSTASIMLSDV